ANVPVGATTGPISVQNPAGTGTSATAFTVFVAPAIVSFTPPNGPIGTEITVRGTGFTAASAVRVNGTVATFTVDSDTLLRATVLAGTTSGPISVENPAGSDTSATSFIVDGTVAVGDHTLPVAFALRQNFPNPFSGRTTIHFELPRAVKVRMTVYDLVGRSIRTLMDGELSAGTHQLSWDARDNSGNSVSSGVYLLKFEAPGFTSTRRLLRTR
ncbi:MAG TPA: FlgD immunoglobulin-like domain containing protein, partial [Candidatus Limnocylindria bacterium]|nr:FlgD immunoglobulin-like domain containing protein [Candidatus Limnocylindria bacterium]